ncbi:hypothetical protein [Sciscionella marina]|uniref:hypothetical protein n=1 Tax=Sciscionella marina TaxID=508770 RepID=UPI00037A2EAE|nr:hypothetical protein [Sciscionella marina]
MTSGTEGHAVIHREAELSSARTLAPVELPAPAEYLAEGAARRLGWHGKPVGQMSIFGRKVIVFAQLRTEAHAERICIGAPPVTDRTEVATWVWPEIAPKAPPVAVDIVGVLAVARHWRTALACAGPFAKYCDTGIVLPWSAAMTGDYLYRCLPRANSHGVAVLTGDPDGKVSLDQAGSQAPLVHEWDTVERWLNEKVYERILACEL